MTATWGSMALTLLAVLVALFKEDIRSRWHRPRLTAKIALCAPDCHKTELVMQNPSSGQILKRGDCYYLRLWVQNDGRERAEKVQVFACSLEKKHADGKFRKVPSFLPMNLRWSHTAPVQIYADAISPGMGKHCDFGHITDPNLRQTAFL